MEEVIKGLYRTLNLYGIRAMSTDEIAYMENHLVALTLVTPSYTIETMLFENNLKYKQP